MRAYLERGKRKAGNANKLPLQSAQNSAGIQTLLDVRRPSYDF
jgi:hypothetical protein